jgi:hypothetical protein
MAWTDEMVAIVRGLIQDYDDDTTTPVTPAVYTDDRLSTILLIAGVNVQNRIDLPTRYTISVSNGTMTPDPTMKATRDDPFINLASLKAACILINAEVRQYTGQGISIRDGTSAVSLQRSGPALVLMQKTYCGEYEDAIYQYLTTKVADGLGEAIVGPVKAWYWGGGVSGDPGYGIYPGPRRLGGRGGAATGDDWYHGGGGYSDAGGNWGYD